MLGPRPKGISGLRMLKKQFSRLRDIIASLIGFWNNIFLGTSIEKIWSTITKCGLLRKFLAIMTLARMKPRGISC